MATPTTKGYLLSDSEAAAVRTWVKRQPRHARNLLAGFESVAARIGRTRQHLSYCLSPTKQKRTPINADDLAALCRMLSSDEEARYQLRRVASDEVQAIMDAVHAEGVGQVITRGAEGVVVLLPL